MSSVHSVRQHLENSDLGAIEDEWLLRADEEPRDLDYFLDVAATLSKAGEEDLAKTLLRLLDEEICSHGLWRERLRLLLESNPRFQRPTLIYDAVLETLREIYSKSESLPQMLKISGLGKVTTELRTLRLQVERLDSLMRLDVGSVVRMEGRGVGRIASINFDLGSYKIDFEGHAGLTVGFKAGAKLLEPLPAGHILRDKLEDPERLKALLDEDPSELLRETLESYDEPLTAGEIRAALEGIVDKEGWSRWWTAARRHPQVLVTSDKRHRYHWAHTHEHASEALIEAFRGADLEGRLDLFSKNARQNPASAAIMAESLTETAEGLLQSKPGRAVEIWLALDRQGLAQPEAGFSPDSVVETSEDIAGLLSRMEAKPSREAVLDSARKTRADWPELYSAALLAESDFGLAAKVAAALEEEAPERLETAIDALLAQPSRCPAAFLWLAQEAARVPQLAERHANRLFPRLLSVVGRREFQPYRAILEPLFESGGTVPKLIGQLREDDAESAEKAIERSTLEEFTKGPLLNALHLRFPDLRQEAAPTALYALPESIEQRSAEAQQLLSTEIPENRKAIQEAAALGDLRENFEYKSARQRHEYLSARLGKLQEELDRAQPIDFSLIDGAEVRVGTTAQLEESTGARRDISLLGPWESDPDNDMVSYLSELGESLIGAEIGDSVRIGDRDYTIIGIRPFREA